MGMGSRVQAGDAMMYQVWLHARHPKTMETVATVRVYAHDDRLRAEAVLENAQADFQPLVLEILRVHPGALVNAEMRQEKSFVVDLPAYDQVAEMKGSGIKRFEPGSYWYMEETPRGDYVLHADVEPLITAVDYYLNAMTPYQQEQASFALQKARAALEKTE